MLGSLAPADTYFVNLSPATIDSALLRHARAREVERRVERQCEGGQEGEEAAAHQRVPERVPAEALADRLEARCLRLDHVLLRRPEQRLAEEGDDRRHQGQRRHQRDCDGDREGGADRPEDPERAEEQRHERHDHRAAGRRDRLTGSLQRVRDGLALLLALAEPFAVAEQEEQDVVGADAVEHHDEDLLDRGVRLQVERGVGRADETGGDQRRPGPPRRPAAGRSARTGRSAPAARRSAVIVAIPTITSALPEASSLSTLEATLPVTPASRSVPSMAAWTSSRSSRASSSASGSKPARSGDSSSWAKPMSLFSDGTTTRPGWLGSGVRKPSNVSPRSPSMDGHGGVGGRQVLLGERLAVLAVEHDRRGDRGVRVREVLGQPVEALDRLVVVGQELRLVGRRLQLGRQSDHQDRRRRPTLR